MKKILDLIFPLLFQTYCTFCICLRMFRATNKQLVFRFVPYLVPPVYVSIVVSFSPFKKICILNLCQHSGTSRDVQYERP